LFCFPLIPLKNAGLSGRRKTKRNMPCGEKNVVHMPVVIAAAKILAVITLQDLFSLW